MRRNLRHRACTAVSDAASLATPVGYRLSTPTQTIPRRSTDCHVLFVVIGLCPLPVYGTAAIRYNDNLWRFANFAEVLVDRLVAAG